MAILRWTSPLQGSESAKAWFGSAVTPPNLRPAWLHDRGGAGGPQQLLGPNYVPPPKDGGVGQPYKNEIWEFRAYTADGYLYFADPNTRIATHTQGLQLLADMAGSWLGAQTPYGPITKVCAVYKTYYSAGARYCRTSSGVVIETTTPTWAGTAGCRPGFRQTQSGGCAPTSAYLYQRRPGLFPLVPFTPYVRTVPVLPFIPFRGSFTVTTTTTPITRPPIVVLRKGMREWPGALGQSEACQALATELANAKKALSDAKGDLVELDAARIEAAQNGNTELANALDQQRPTLVSYINAAQGAVNQLQAQYNDCESMQPPQGGGAQPPPPSGINCNTDAGCNPNQKCVNGICTDVCPEGQVVRADGTCGPAVTTAGMGGTGLAWLLGIGAALGAIFLGAGKRPGKARARPRRRSARRRAA